MSALLHRIKRLESARKDDPLLIYTHEIDDGHGGLILLSDRGSNGDLLEVGRVSPADVQRHKLETIRIQRSY